MIDSLRRFDRTALARRAWTRYGLDEHGYVLVTLHRPSNVDDPARLAGVVDGLCALAERLPAVFPMHPRTRARLASCAALERLEAAGLRCVDPIGYLDFLSLEARAGAIVTDSGGVQEEAAAFGVPCYTLRANTERPVTLSHGTNVLLGEDPASLARVRLSPSAPAPCAIPLWDGHAALRAADAIVAAFPDLAESRPAAVA
jgi:UDP-N-acetylglucosamine 2-epimerase (non-hydrolysing)